MATSVLSARSAAVTMSSESASSCSVIGSGSTGSDAEILVGRRSVSDRQLLVPSPMWHLFRSLDLAMPATDRLPGTLGPYRLQDRLGGGGMGVVHLARAPESGNARLRRAREVEPMRGVRSAFVAEVLDADVTGEFPYIVTRYVPGPTLEAMVRGRGPLSGAGLRRLAYGTAEALTAIHAAGVVHRDLKPGNVMLTDDRPVVIDFGIAQSPES